MPTSEFGTLERELSISLSSSSSQGSSCMVDADLERVRWAPACIQGTPTALLCAALWCSSAACGNRPPLKHAAAPAGVADAAQGHSGSLGISPRSALAASPQAHCQLPYTQSTHQGWASAWELTLGKGRVAAAAAGARAAGPAAAQGAQVQVRAIRLDLPQWCKWKAPCCLDQIRAMVALAGRLAAGC
jgi:hypothetical protein